MADWKNFAVSVLGDAGGLLGAHGVAGKEGFLTYMQQMAARDQQRAAQNFTREMKQSDQMFAASEGRKNRQATAELHRARAVETTTTQRQAQQQAINALAVRMVDDPGFSHEVQGHVGAMGGVGPIAPFDPAMGASSAYPWAAAYVSLFGEREAWTRPDELQQSADRYAAAYAAMNMVWDGEQDAGKLAQTQQQARAAETAVQQDDNDLAVNQASLTNAAKGESAADRLADLQRVRETWKRIGEQAASREDRYPAFLGAGGISTDAWVSVMRAHEAQGQAIDSEMRSTKKDIIANYNIRAGGAASWPIFDINVVENRIELDEMLGTPSVTSQLAPANSLLAMLPQWSDSEMRMVGHGPGSGLWELRAAAITARNSDRQFSAEGLVRDHWDSLRGAAPSPSMQAATLGRLDTSARVDSVSFGRKGTAIRHVVADTANIKAFLGGINNTLPPEYHLEHSADEIESIRREFGTPNQRVAVGDSLSPGGIDGQVKWDADAEARYKDSPRFRIPLADAIWSDANAYLAAGGMGIATVGDALSHSKEAIMYLDDLTVPTKKFLVGQLEEWSGLAADITGSVSPLYETSGDMTQVLSDGISYRDPLPPSAQVAQAEALVTAVWGSQRPSEVEWEHAVSELGATLGHDSMTLFDMSSFFRTVSPLFGQLMDRDPGSSPSATWGKATGDINPPGWWRFGGGETTLEGGTRAVEGTALGAIGHDFGVGAGSPDSTRYIFGDLSLARQLSRDGAPAAQIESAGILDVIRGADLSEGAIGSQANQALATSMQAHLRAMPDNELLRSLVTGGFGPDGMPGISLSRLIPPTASAPTSEINILDPRARVRKVIGSNLEEVKANLRRLESLKAIGDFRGKPYDADPGPGIELNHLNEALLDSEIANLEEQVTGLEVAHFATLTHEITSSSAQSAANILRDIDSMTALSTVLKTPKLGALLGATDAIMKMEVKPWTQLGEDMQQEDAGAENSLRMMFGLFADWGSYARKSKSSQTAVPMQDRLPLLIEERRAMESHMDMILQLAADPQIERKMEELSPSLHTWLGDGFDRMEVDTQDQKVWKAARIWRALVMDAQL